jgi:hypothetical protein
MEKNPPVPPIYPPPAFMENLFLFFFFQNSLLHFCCTLSLCDYLLRETAQTPCRQTREELSLNLLALVSAKDKSRKKGGGRPKRMGRSNDCRGRRWRKFGRSCCRVLVFFFAKRNWAAVRELRVGGQSPQLCKDLRLVSARRPHGRCVCQWAG